MVGMWYEGIITSIISLKTDVFFILDPINLSQISKVKEILSKKFSIIVEYKNELKLRKLLREKGQKILVIFHDKNDIPFDLLSTHATIEIDIDETFPLLNKEVLLGYSFNDYQNFYGEYIELKKNRFDRLSEQETRNFINKILSSEVIKDKNRALKLIGSLNEMLSGLLTDSNTWGTISQFFGELMFLIDENNLNIDVEEIKLEVIKKFNAYILNYYEDLIYSTNSLINSNLLDIIFNHPDKKNALICFDCMGFEEWNVIKEYLERKVGLKYDIKHSFSMLPSETNYSGNALFAGLTPKKVKKLEFINEINWKNEKRLFKHCLNKKIGMDSTLIYFQRCVDATDIKIGFESFSDYSAIGLVFSFIDRLTHTNLMDKNRLIQNIKMHLEKSNIDIFIQSLLNQGFCVYFTSDHGSTFCKGNNIKISRDLVNSKAKRYLLSDKKELLEEYKTKDSIILQLKNMVGGDHLLLLTGNSMFAGRNDEELTHGGISIEEMIVPFIEVK